MIARKGEKGCAKGRFGRLWQRKSKKMRFFLKKVVRIKIFSDICTPKREHDSRKAEIAQR